MNQIGFIGVGIMGKGMVRNLMKAGFQVHIYARHPEKVADVVQEGALLHGSIAECAAESEAVITIVGSPQDVEEVYFGKDGLLENGKAGSVLIDMTTTVPSLSQRLYEEGKKRGFRMVDAPVTGGEAGAKNGTLSILAGGDRENFEACMPLFQAMGNNINYQGGPGSGQHTKMVNQIMVAGTLSGICEALAYAQAKDLDLEVLLRSLSTGAAGSKQLDAYGLKIASGDYRPGFFIRHFVKDMKIAKEEAEKSGLALSVLPQVLSEYQVLENEGLGEEGIQGLIRYYQEFSGSAAAKESER